MKKFFLAILTIILILSFCACRANTTEDSDIPQDDPIYEDEFPDEEVTDEEFNDEETAKEIDGINYRKDDKGGTRGYEAFSDAYREFANYVIEKSKEEETVMNNYPKVLSPEFKVLDYMTPLMNWGETFDDDEVIQGEMFIKLFTGEGKNFRSAELQKESDNRYTMTMETKKGEQIHVQVMYYPDIDAVRLEAENSNGHEMLFEYVKTADGYAAQYYFFDMIRSSYNKHDGVMCVYRSIFSENEGSCARFEEADKPVSLIDRVPDEKELIEGATHWFTLKNGKFTGEMDGTAF